MFKRADRRLHDVLLSVVVAVPLIVLFSWGLSAVVRIGFDTPIAHVPWGETTPSYFLVVSDNPEITDRVAVYPGDKEYEKALKGDYEVEYDRPLQEGTIFDGHELKGE